MASKYGMQKYGANLYSSAITDLTGVNLSIPVSLSGRFGRNRALAKDLLIVMGVTADIRESESVIGTLPISVSMGGTLHRVKDVRGGFAISNSLSGIIRENDGFRTALPISIGFHAILSRPSPQLFVAHLDIRPVFTGKITALWPLVGQPIIVHINIGGGDTVYLGPFWDPDEPVDGSFTPIEPPEDVWTPDTPDDPFWVPVTPDRQWSR